MGFAGKSPAVAGGAGPVGGGGGAGPFEAEALWMDFLRSPKVRGLRLAERRDASGHDVLACTRPRCSGPIPGRAHGRESLSCSPKSRLDKGPVAGQNG